MKIGNSSRAHQIMLTIAVSFLSLSLFAQNGGGSSGGNKGDKGPKRSEFWVVVEPDSVTLEIGRSQQFQAYLEDSTGARKDTTFAWSLSGNEIGTLSDDGLFSALERGTTHVVASVGRLAGKALVHVIGDSTQKNFIKLGLHIRIEPSAVILAVGDTLTFTAVCMDSMGQIIDTTFSWSVEGDFAAITEDGFLEVYEDGRGFVYASIGDLSGKANVVVRDNSATDPEKPTKRNRYRLVIGPRDTTLLIGQTVQFQAFLEDTSGNQQATSVSWMLRGNQAGTLSETGLFTAESRGIAMIQAKSGNYSAVTRVMVQTQQDSSECDSVHIRLHDRDGIQVGNVKQIAESDILKISGLPFPLNILNGGELILPAGSLDEGITIEISLPDLAVIRGDTSVSFTEAIINGFSFDVYVNGVKVSPYVFDTPVQVVLPYKADLMETLSITPDDLAVFFYNEDGTFDDAGIFNVVVDTTENKVYAEVAHFSQVLLGDRAELTPTSVSSESTKLPNRYALYANYPNPFNPETEIRFDVTGTGNQRVKLTIYDLLGRQIRTLVNASYQAGHHVVRWDGRDGRGNRVASGVYLYRLEAGSVRLTRRMVLLQ